MTEEEIKHLRNLCNRAVRDLIHEQGSAYTVIYKAEFHALEEAIRQLTRTPKVSNRQNATQPLQPIIGTTLEGKPLIDPNRVRQ